MNKVILVAGPSGSGKTALVMGVLSLLKNNGLSRIITQTTRSPRRDERNGVDYHFITTEQFKQEVQDGKLVEWTSYGGHLYGTPISSMADGEHKIGIVTLSGIVDYAVWGNANVHADYDREVIRTIYITARASVLRKRLEDRGEENIQLRMKDVPLMGGPPSVIRWDACINNERDMKDPILNLASVISRFIGRENVSDILNS